MDIKILEHLLFIHVHDLGALNHFPKLPECPKYPEGGMTSSGNHIKDNEAIIIPNCKNWNVNFEEFKTLKIMLYFFILH